MMQVVLAQFHPTNMLLICNILFRQWIETANFSLWRLNLYKVHISLYSSINKVTHIIVLTNQIFVFLYLSMYYEICQPYFPTNYNQLESPWSSLAFNEPTRLERPSLVSLNEPIKACMTSCFCKDQFQYDHTMHSIL